MKNILSCLVLLLYALDISAQSNIDVDLSLALNIHNSVNEKENLGFSEKKINLVLQTRDSISNKIVETEEAVDVSKIGIVIVDPWNYHWCMTACERVNAMVPRWNKAIEGGRKLGMPIIWAPSDVVGMYSGTPQREKALGVELLNVPVINEMPPVKFTAKIGRCMCGPGINCKLNYGWDGINPDLVIAENDFIASSTPEVYTLLKNKGITHVIYMGLHTNHCLFGKPGALKFMVQAGLKCMLARDINDAQTEYNPNANITPDDGTRITDEDLERAGVPSINVANEWKKVGLWDDNWVIETVRITPWGKPKRPYFFRQTTKVALTTPLLHDVQIRYTLNGEEPTNESKEYEKYILIDRTTEIKAAAFIDNKIVSIPTSAYYVKMPTTPPKPDIYIDDLKFVADPYGDGDEVLAACFWIPKIGQSYVDTPLRIRKILYERGLGFLAPSSIRYKIEDNYDRFVAKVGIDDNRMDTQLGRNLVMHCSVVFRIFIDGEFMAESPVMRIGQEPWGFDVEIPEGSRYINLVCMDAGSRSTLDYGNYVDAGFCVK